jgi:hypothetical protein
VVPGDCHPAEWTDGLPGFGGTGRAAWIGYGPWGSVPAGVSMAGDRHDWPLMLAAAILGVALVAVLAYVVLGQGSSPGATASAPENQTTATTPTRSPVELWEAYEQARSAARARLPDAALVSASTQWQQPDEPALLAGAFDWSFVFYSPEKRSTLDVVYSAGAAQVVKETQVWVSPGVLEEGKWRAGPRDALLAFLAYGGRPFLEKHPEAVVDLNLGPGDGEATVWTVVALDVSDRGVLAVSVDAESGAIVTGGS